MAMLHRQLVYMTSALHACILLFVHNPGPFGFKGCKKGYRFVRLALPSMEEKKLNVAETNTMR